MRTMVAARTIGWPALKGLFWLFRLPIVFAINIARFMTLRPLMGDSIPCATCGTEIVLLGLWECHCGYHFYGWYWSRCEVCGDLPAFVNCFQCGASTKSPVLFG